MSDPIHSDKSDAKTAVERCAAMCREHQHESPFAAKLAVQMERYAASLDSPCGDGDAKSTPRTDAHLAHLNLPDGRKVGIPNETVELLRHLERELAEAEDFNRRKWGAQRTPSATERDVQRQDMTRLEWLANLLQHCPHAELKYNDDADDGPVGWSLVIESCSRMDLKAPTLEALIDLGIGTEPDEDGNVEAKAPLPEAAEHEPCKHAVKLHGFSRGYGMSWCDGCGKLLWCSDGIIPAHKDKNDDYGAWCVLRVVAWGCQSEAGGGKKCARPCGNCGMSLNTPLSPQRFEKEKP